LRIYLFAAATKFLIFDKDCTSVTVSRRLSGRARAAAALPWERLMLAAHAARGAADGGVLGRYPQ